METEEYYGGLMPEPMEYEDTVKERTIKVRVVYTTYVHVRSKNEDIEKELDKFTKWDLTEDVSDVDDMEITSWEEV